MIVTTIINPILVEGNIWKELSRYPVKLDEVKTSYSEILYNIETT